MSLSALLTRITGSPRTHSFEHRSIHIVLFITAYSCAFAALLDWWLGLNEPAVLNGIGVLGFGILYHQTKVRGQTQRLVIPVLAVFMAFTSAFWFLSDGIVGITPLIFLAFLALSLIYLPRHHHSAWVMVLGANVLLLFIIDYVWPDLVLRFSGRVEAQWAHFITLLICWTIVWVALSLNKQEFDSERKALQVGATESQSGTRPICVQRGA